MNKFHRYSLMRLDWNSRPTSKNVRKCRFIACDHRENTCWGSIMYFIEAQAQYKKQKQTKSQCNSVTEKSGTSITK